MLHIQYPVGAGAPQNDNRMTLGQDQREFKSVKLVRICLLLALSETPFISFIVLFPNSSFFAPVVGVCVCVCVCILFGGKV